MVQYYFLDEEATSCYTLDYIKDQIQNGLGLEEKEVYLAKKVKGDSDFFFCKVVGEVGEKGECGKICKDYQPRNGKSGCCRHFGNLYEPTEKVWVRV